MSTFIISFSFFIVPFLQLTESASTRRMKSPCAARSATRGGALTPAPRGGAVTPRGDAVNPAPREGAEAENGMSGNRALTRKDDARPICTFEGPIRCKVHSGVTVKLFSWCCKTLILRQLYLPKSDIFVRIKCCHLCI